MVVVSEELLGIATPPSHTEQTAHRRPCKDLRMPYRPVRSAVKRLAIKCISKRPCNVRSTTYQCTAMLRTVQFIFFSYIIYKPRYRWVDNIRMDLQEVGCGNVDWIGLTQDRDRWRTLVSTVMNLRVP